MFLFTSQIYLTDFVPGVNWPFKLGLVSVVPDLLDYESSTENEETALDVVTIDEIYYLWRLAGGDVLSELRKHGLVVPKPPILALPKIVLNEGQSFGAPKERCNLYDQTVLKLNLNQLINCLSTLTVDDFYPLITNRGNSSLLQDTKQKPMKEI